MNFFMECPPKQQTELAPSRFCLTQNEAQSPSPSSGDLEVPHYVLSQLFMERELKEHLNYLYSRHFYPLKLFTKDTHVHKKFYGFATLSLESCLKIMMLYWFFYNLPFKFNRKLSWDIWNCVFYNYFGDRRERKILQFLFKNDGKGGN